MTGVSFGVYDVFAATPNNNGVSGLSIHCQKGGGSTFVVNRSTDVTLGVFGQLPAAQDAQVGVYTDSIVATVNF